MASETFIRRCRNGYGKLLRLYPATYRNRFGEGMQQTFNDLCRERVKEGKRLFSFAAWMFVETAAGILREHATHNIRIIMKPNSTQFLKMVKYSAMTLGALMVIGIVTLMMLARGTGEDIAGIIAMGLLVTMVSGIVATVAAVLQKRAQTPRP
jgi:hypothetical protein